MASKEQQNKVRKLAKVSGWRFTTNWHEKAEKISAEQKRKKSGWRSQLETKASDSIEGERGERERERERLLSRWGPWRNAMACGGGSGPIER
jgi:hypothetical protein